MLSYDMICCHLLCCHVVWYLVVFQVNALWLLDLEEYNEWMNEEDYLVTEGGGCLVSFRISFNQLIIFKNNNNNRNDYIKNDCMPYTPVSISVSNKRTC